MHSNFRSVLSPKCGRRFSRSSLQCSPRSIEKELENLEINSSQRRRKLSLSSSASPQKKSRSDSISFVPQVFLRCHSCNNDPQDCKSQVWAASFEPHCAKEECTSDLVATCGGNVVCFINCRTGHVLKRYKCEPSSENLFALAWTILSVNGNNANKTTVLAAGGSEKKIYLLHPSQLKCYMKFKAHSGNINCLQFHPSKKTWLFSCSADECIHLWDIGGLALPSYKTSHNKLMTFQAYSEVVQLAISSSHNCLFAASHKGLKVWSIEGEPGTWTKSHPVNLLIPETCRAKGTNLVDGLTFISPNCLGVKVSRSGNIFLSDISGLFKKGRLLKETSFQLPATVIFLWSDSNSDYNYLSSSLSGDIMACGDNSGSIWIYDTEDYMHDKLQARHELELPSVMLQWPHLKFEMEDLAVSKKVIMNSVSFNWNGEYLVACTDSNLVCVWKRHFADDKDLCD